MIVLCALDAEPVPAPALTIAGTTFCSRDCADIAVWCGRCDNPRTCRCGLFAALFSDPGYLLPEITIPTPIGGTR